MRVVHRFRPDQFPIIVTIYSKLGHELWSRTIEQPQNLAAIAIPGYGGTEHAPVRVAIEFADGSMELAE